MVAFAPFHQAAIFTPGSAPALVNLVNVNSVVAAVEIPGTDRVVALDPATPSLNVFSFPPGVSDAGAVGSVGGCVDRESTDLALSLVDLDGDGHGDVVVESPRDDFFEVHLGYPDGGFEDLHRVDGAACGAGRTFTIPELGDAGYTLAVADVTGDARPDVVVVPRDLDVLEVFTNASDDAGLRLLQPSDASSGDSCSRHTLGLSGQNKVGVAAIDSPGGTRLVIATDSQGLHILGRR